jgi:small subunit ribosomal protein S17
MKKTETKIEKERTKQEREREKLAGAGCKDKNCHIHGNLSIRGKIFEGRVIRKFPKRVVIEFERMIYSRKYERYFKEKTKIHSRLPECMEKEIQVGDLIKVRECRPLSKLVHSVVIGKVKETKKKGK